jgi:hypothetical protein
MDPYAPEGILPNILRFADRPGQAVRNVFRGNFGAAGRQVLDILGELIDAPLPGDWIPSATSREDYVSGSELVGMEQKPGLARTAVDIGVGLVTDPLTYLSFGAIPAAKGIAGATAKHTIEAGIPFLGKGARTTLGTFDQAVDPLSLAMRGADTGIKKATGAIDRMTASGTTAGKQDAPLTQGYEAAKTWVRRAAGAEDLTKDTKLSLQKGSAQAAAASKFWTGQGEQALKGLTPDERIMLGKAFYGVDAGTLNPKQATQFVAMSDDPLRNVDVLARKYGKDPLKMQQAAQRILDVSKRQWDEGVANGLFDAGSGREGYLQRQWYMDPDSYVDTNPRLSASMAAATKEAKLQTPDQIADFFNKHKDEVGAELDAGRLLLNRASQQGKMLGQASVAKSMGGVGTLAGKELKTSAKEQIAQMAAAGAFKGKDDVAAITRAIDGMGPRDGILKALAGWNRMVKGPMVYGIVLPKFGSMVRNKLGMAFQALATPGAREQAIPQLKSIFNDIGRSWDEAYGEVVFGTGKSFARGDEIGKAMTALDDAFLTAKNTADVSQVLRSKGANELANAVDTGVLDGFVSTEELLTKLSASPGKQKWRDIRDAPGVMFQTLEQRGRLQMFLNLRKAGKSPEEAAMLTKDALYDYGLSSPENRALRDVLPFGQFMAKAIPQQAKMLSTQPASAVALAPLFYDPSGEEGPIYPYMQGKSRVGMGEDTAGNPLYLSGFGLPVESLDMLPNLSADMRVAGRDVQSGLLSSTQPLLKTAAAFATGEDPYFGTAFGSYSKLPVVGEAGDIGRYGNMILGTGIGEPFGAGILRQIGQATDERKPIAARGLDLITGAKLTAVDPDQAQARVISDYLEARPDVAQYRTFYKSEDDPEFSSLMSELAAAKKRAKANKEAAALAAP